MGDRLSEVGALIDDARCLVADLQAQKNHPALIDLRIYLNWALSALERAEQ